MKQKYYSIWKNIDKANNPQKFLSFLDTTSNLPSYKRYKKENYENLGLKGEENVLDIGCGLGDDVRNLVKLFDVRVVGLDSSKEMIVEARKRSLKEGVSATFIKGDITHLPFKDNSFDVVRADRVLKYQSDPKRSVKEMVRVTKPRGIISVSDQDWSSWVINTDEKATFRKLKSLKIKSFADGQIGKELSTMFANNEMLKNIQQFTNSLVRHDYINYIPILNDLLKHARSLGLVSSNEAKNFRDDMRYKHDQGLFSSRVTIYTVIGRKNSPG